MHVQDGHPAVLLWDKNVNKIFQLSYCSFNQTSSILYCTCIISGILHLWSIHTYTINLFNLLKLHCRRFVLLTVASRYWLLFSTFLYFGIHYSHDCVVIQSFIFLLIMLSMHLLWCTGNCSWLVMNLAKFFLHNN